MENKLRRCVIFQIVALFLVVCVVVLLIVKVGGFLLNVFKGFLAVVLNCFYVVVGLLIVMSIVRCFI